MCQFARAAWAVIPIGIEIIDDREIYVIIADLFNVIFGSYQRNTAAAIC